MNENHEQSAQIGDGTGASSTGSRIPSAGNGHSRWKKGPLACHFQRTIFLRHWVLNTVVLGFLVTPKCDLEIDV